MSAESIETIVEKLRPKMEFIFSERKRKRRIQLCDADNFLSDSAVIIRNTLLDDETDELFELEKYSAEGRKIMLSAYVKLKGGRKVSWTSSEAVKRELKPLLKSIEDLNPYTTDLLADKGIDPDEINKIASSCSDILSGLKKKKGNTHSARDGEAILFLSHFYAKYVDSRPASRGLESLFTRYVLACYSIAESEISDDTIEKKIISYNLRHPFDKRFNADGSLIPRVIRPRYCQEEK